MRYRLRAGFKKRPKVFYLLLLWMILTASVVSSFFGGSTFGSDKLFIDAHHGVVVLIVGYMPWELIDNFPSLRGFNLWGRPFLNPDDRSVLAQLIRLFELPRTDGEECYVIPLGWPLLLTGLFVMFMFWRPIGRFGPADCRKCGYALTGNTSGRCPECGTLKASAPVKENEVIGSP